jgi:uncharacterized protein DUF2459
MCTMHLPPLPTVSIRLRALLLCAGLLLAGCSAFMPTPPAAVSPAAGARLPPSATIYVVRRAWHIDIGFAVDELDAPLRALAQPFPGTRYLSFGFGDRRYLEARNRGLPNMLAALWPGKGLILMTALEDSPARSFGEQQVIALPLDAEQARAAQSYILASLAQQDGAAQSEGPGPYEGSEYLRAVAQYSAIHTCNTWAAEVLQAAGVPVRSRGVLFAGQLWRQVRAAAVPEVSGRAD